MEKVVGGIFLFELYFLIIERKLQNGFAHSPKNVIKIVYLLISIIKFLIMTIFMSHFFYFVYLTKMFSQIKLFSFSDLGIYNTYLTSSESIPDMNYNTFFNINLIPNLVEMM